jgi:hypothetical protein
MVCRVIYDVAVLLLLLCLPTLLCSVSLKLSVHEVYIDEEQMMWFEGILAANPHRPIIVFTHAPPMGSGLKVVANVHVKNR